MGSANTNFKIQEILFCFMRAFDNKDWDAMRDCFSEIIYCDYSSFCSEKPGPVSRKHYIDQRKNALAELKTQHNLFNLSVKHSGKIAEVSCNYAIYRFHPEFTGSREHFFHSYGQYLFKLVRKNRDWKISSITQILLMNDGNPELHGATRNNSENN